MLCLCLEVILKVSALCIEDKGKKCMLSILHPKNRSHTFEKFVKLLPYALSSMAAVAQAVVNKTPQEQLPRFLGICPKDKLIRFSKVNVAMPYYENTCHEARIQMLILTKMQIGWWQYIYFYDSAPQLRKKAIITLWWFSMTHLRLNFVASLQQHTHFYSTTNTLILQISGFRCGFFFRLWLSTHITPILCGQIFRGQLTWVLLTA